MTAKFWGGILVGVFVVAAGAEIVRRKCPGLAKKISDGAKKVTGCTCEKINKFTSDAKGAFQKGYSSARA